MRRIRIYFLAFFSLMLCDVASANQSQDNSIYSQGKIVLEGVTNGIHELHVFDIATKKDKILYRDENSEFSPQMSPDGGLVAFSIYDINDKKRRTYMVDVVTGKIRLFLDMPQGCQAEKWSPDGFQLLLSCGRPWQNDLYIINRDGTGLKQLTNDSSFKLTCSWRPDGSQILCTKHFYKPLDAGSAIYTQPAEIWAINTDGSGETLLSQGQNPKWSSDGSLVVFVKDIETGELCVSKQRVGLMDATGAFLGFLSYDEADTLYKPTLNFNGSQVAFMRHHEMRLVDVKKALAGQIEERSIVPSARSQDNDYCWSPDGSQIIFPATDKPINCQPAALYIVDADGSNSHVLTGHNWHSIDLEWLVPVIPEAPLSNPSSSKF